jgi:hypothetical protein
MSRRKSTAEVRTLHERALWYVDRNNHGGFTLYKPDGEGGSQGVCDDIRLRSDKWDDGERIAACVNACANLSMDDLRGLTMKFRQAPDGMAMDMLVANVAHAIRDDIASGKYIREQDPDAIKATLGIAAAAIDAINPVDLLKTLTDEERVATFHEFCIHCGTDILPCSCWRDE